MANPMSSRNQTHARPDGQMGHFASREKHPGELAYDWRSRRHIDQGLKPQVMKQHSSKKRRQRDKRIISED